jgi:hypothetical protein
MNFCGNVIRPTVKGSTAYQVELYGRVSRDDYDPAVPPRVVTTRAGEEGLLAALMKQIDPADGIVVIITEGEERMVWAKNATGSGVDALFPNNTDHETFDPLGSGRKTKEYWSRVIKYISETFKFIH